jgi:hypothetical protein
MHKGKNNKGVFPKGAGQAKVKNRYKFNTHGYGDGSWKNQGLFAPLQNIRTRNLPLWQRKPNRRTYTGQVPGTECTAGIIQTKFSKIWELANKQTRANIKTFKIIFIVYKIDKL